MPLVRRAAFAVACGGDADSVTCLCVNRGGLVPRDQLLLHAQHPPCVPHPPGGLRRVCGLVPRPYRECGHEVRRTVARGDRVGEELVTNGAVLAKAGVSRPIETCNRGVPQSNRCSTYNVYITVALFQPIITAKTRHTVKSRAAILTPRWSQRAGRVHTSRLRVVQRRLLVRAAIGVGLAPFPAACVTLACPVGLPK